MGNDASTSSRSQTIGRDLSAKPASRSGKQIVRPSSGPNSVQKIPETDLTVHFEGYRDLPLLLAVVDEETDHAAYQHLRVDLLRSVRWAAYGRSNGSQLSMAEAKSALLKTVGAVQPKVLLARGSATETVAKALEDRSLLVPALILIQPTKATLCHKALQDFQGHLLIIASGESMETSEWSDLQFPLAASFTKSVVAGSGSHPEEENPASVNAIIAAGLRKLRSSDALS